MMNRRDFSLAALAAVFAGATSVVPLAQGQGGGRGRGSSGGRGGMGGGGRGGMGGGGMGGGMGGGGRGGMGGGMGSVLVVPADHSFFASKPQASDPREKQVLDVIQEILAEPRASSIPLGDGRLLRLLTEISNAKHVVEIGTRRGLSGLWFAMALQRTGGKLTTHDLDDGFIKVAQEHFIRAGVEKIVTVVEGDAHETVKTLNGPIDLLFLDADKEGFLDYLDQLLPKVRIGGLIISRELSSKQADAAFIKRVTTDPKLESILVSLEDNGICVTLKKA